MSKCHFFRQFDIVLDNDLNNSHLDFVIKEIVMCLSFGLGAKSSMVNGGLHADACNRRHVRAR